MDRGDTKSWFRKQTFFMVLTCQRLCLGSVKPPERLGLDPASTSAVSSVSTTKLVELKLISRLIKGCYTVLHCATRLPLKLKTPCSLLPYWFYIMWILRNGWEGLCHFNSLTVFCRSQSVNLSYISLDRLMTAMSSRWSHCLCICLSTSDKKKTFLNGNLSVLH